VRSNGDPLSRREARDASQWTLVSSHPPIPTRVVLLSGPSGSGTSLLAAGSGLPVPRLDDFYKEGDDPCDGDEALGRLAAAAAAAAAGRIARTKTTATIH
jgi:hypothetical protein